MSGPPGTAGLLGLHHVQVSCPPGGEDAARAFWVGSVGLVELTKPAGLVPRGGCWFGAPGSALAVHVGVEDPFRPATRAHPALQLADPPALAALVGRLRADGRAVRPDALLPGYVRFYTDDSHGNRIEFLARDPAEPDPGF